MPKNVTFEINDIDHCVLKMQDIIHWSVKNDSHLGYFAILYQTVTKKVKNEIEQGRFENNDLMTAMVSNFANRYLIAINEYFENDNSVSKSWDKSFNLKNPQDYCVLQHLMLGMNAHIIFDLAISSAAVAPNEKIFDFKKDFLIINDILIGMIDEMQEMISKVFWIMKPLDFMLGRLDEKIAAHIIFLARNKAWDLARLIALSDEEHKGAILEEMEMEATFISHRILSPSGALKLFSKFLILFESNDVSINLNRMIAFQKSIYK
tara:strand:- start:172 stop:963 length:792 start_codon:yes stop_codon:yes gene_type:complete